MVYYFNEYLLRHVPSKVFFQFDNTKLLTADQEEVISNTEIIDQVERMLISFEREVFENCGLPNSLLMNSKLISPSCRLLIKIHINKNFSDALV